jgi:D-alanyl-lipoteichoic acid acyltransferase DltB (MBOAT superfamily)
VAGPIVRARDFIPQIRRPLCVTNEMFGRAVFLIIAGLFKKAVISDYISVNLVERVFAQPDLYSGLENLLAVYGYTLQIYCDFSGYSDMAIGLALMLGFEFPKNFDSPYKSQSITEFWRRWHISLSSWLKDYLYISLGGNRKGKFRQYVNLMLTMLLGGLWHGASLNFVVWGGFHGLMLVVDKLCNASFLKKQKENTAGISWWRVLLTFHLAAFAWIFFRNQTFEGSFLMLSQIFTNFQPQIFMQWCESYWAVGLLMLLGYVLHFLPARWSANTQHFVTRSPLVLQAVYVIAVIFIVLQVKSSDVQPFIYFQF